MSGLHEQLLLGLRPRPAVTFATFFAAADNAATLHALRVWLAQGTGVFYLFGATGSGRSHLLQAASTATADSLYLPLMELKDIDPTPLFEGLDDLALLCLDDIDRVVANPGWSDALFHCFNRHIGTAPEAAGGRWLVSAEAPPTQLICPLPDLISRLGWGGCYRLAPLDDAGRVQMLQLQAQQRGMDIPDELAVYILQRYSRDSQALLNLLERIDRTSLHDRKRVSLSLVRKLLNDSA